MSRVRTHCDIVTRAHEYTNTNTYTNIIRFGTSTDISA